MIKHFKKFEIIISDRILKKNRLMIIGSIFVSALLLVSLGDMAEAQGFYNYTQAQTWPCCSVDVVMLIDRGYFVNQSQFDAIQMSMWTGNETGCMDIRVAAVEFGTNVSVTYWLGNFTTSTEALQVLRNYTLGPDLGPDHNADLAYAITNSDVLIPMNGLRMNATAFTVLFTGADPTGNLSALMEAVNITKVLATSLVVAVGNNFTASNLTELATAPRYFFQFNDTSMPINDTSMVPAAICPAAYGGITCCKSDVVYVIDRAYFGSLNATERDTIFNSTFNSTDFLCPDLRIAIVEYGSNASVILYLTNFTSPNETMAYLLNYTLGPDLGPDHNVDLAYPLIRDQVFNETNGRRSDANAIVVLITGADPTNQTLAESEARRTETEVPATLLVEAVGDNFTTSYLQALATTPMDFFTVPSNGTAFDSTDLFTDVCRIRPKPLPVPTNVTCCPIDIVYMIDRAYFGTLNTTDQQTIFSGLFNDSLLECPEVQIAIIEFGSNYSIISYLSNVTAMNTTLMNYTIGPDLGPEHREELVYPVIRNEILAGRRMNASAVVILVTGADTTDPRASTIEAMLTEWNATLKVLAIGDNYTALYLKQLASLSSDFVQMPMVNETGGYNSTQLYGDVCGVRPPKPAPAPACPTPCKADVVLLIDRAYFGSNDTLALIGALGNQTNQTQSILEQLQSLRNSSEFSCPDLQLAIIEFGSNASAIIYFTNFTNSNVTNMTLADFMQNYTLGPDLGPDHNVDMAFLLARTQVLIPEYGRRENVSAVIVLITGADPTNQTAAEAEAAILKQNATIIVQAIGDNYTRSALEALASSPQDFFELNQNQTTNTSDLINAICRRENVTAPTPAPAAACPTPCKADVVLLIDRAYFGSNDTLALIGALGNQTNQTQSNQTQSILEQLQSLRNSSEFSCPDLQLAIIEYGSNASVIIYFTNFTNSNVTNMTLADFMQNYTLGTDLGPDHNVDMAFFLARTQVLIPEYGRRENVSAVIVLITGADPTNQTAAEAEAAILKQNATIIVQAIGDNYTRPALEALASSPQDFFELNQNQTTNTSELINAICRRENVTAPTPAPATTCATPCKADVVLIIDRAYFGSNDTMALIGALGNQTNQTQSILEQLQSLRNSSEFSCPDLQLAIIEYGSNASVIIYFTNFTTSMAGNVTNMTMADFMQNYTLGTDLGPDHNVDMAFFLARTQVLIPENGRRENVSAVVLLITGADPTNQTAAEAEAALLKQNATIIVQAIGDNYTMSALEALASSPQDFFQLNQTSAPTNASDLINAVCRRENSTSPTVAPSPAPSNNVTECTSIDIVLVIDRAYFGSNETASLLSGTANQTSDNQTSTNQTQSILGQLLSLRTNPEFSCPDVQLAIIEYGSNASVILYFTNFTTSMAGNVPNMTLADFMQNYTLGPDLGPDHDLAQALFLARTQVLTPENGRRENASAFVIVITGENATNQTAAEEEAMALQNNNVTTIVILLPDNGTASAMGPIASSPEDLFVVSPSKPINAAQLIGAMRPMRPNVTANVTTTAAPLTNVTSSPIGNFSSTPSRRTRPIVHLTTEMAPANVTTIDGTPYCFTSQNRANSKSLFPNPDDCHSFYQCFYNSPTKATGILQHCPPGTFFHTDILVCLPEGSTPCQDQCQSVTAASCYAEPGNCVQFYKCANGASYGQCCPKDTRFNPDICACEDDEYCTDQCMLPVVANVTTVRPPIVNMTTMSCIDSTGNEYRAVPNRPEVFQQTIVYSRRRRPRVVTQTCPPGTAFTLSECACTVPANVTLAPSVSPNQCLLYLPFDGDFTDASIYKFSAFPYGNVAINTASPAAGNGSLYVDGGRLEIPGLAAADFRQAASYCFFFRCDSASGCSVNGGLLSNNRDSSATQFSIIIASLANNSVMAQLQFREPSAAPMNLFGNLAGGGAASVSTVSPAAGGSTSPSGMTESSTASGATSPGTESTTPSMSTEATTGSSTGAESTTQTGTESTTSSSFGTTSELLNVTSSPSLNETTSSGLLNVTSSPSLNETTSAAGVTGTETSSTAGNETSSVTPGPILGAAPVTVSVPTGTWQHICLVITPKSTILYLNGSPVQTESTGGTLRIVQSPYTLGSDQAFGDFRGSIDEVLVCESALTANDVAAHLNGDKATLSSRGYLPASSQP